MLARLAEWLNLSPANRNVVADEPAAVVSHSTPIDDARRRVEYANTLLSQSFTPDQLAGAKVLDIGCGTGNGIIAALKLGAGMAVGVDRSGSEFGETYFAELAEEAGIDKRKGLLLEGDIFQMSFFDDGFDIVLMYDTIEHVPDPKAFIEFCGRALRPGGVGLIHTCPLYYSANGHHLWNYFPEERAPWAHLYKDFGEISIEAQGHEWGWRHYEELNKVTLGDIKRHLKSAGLELVQDNSVWHERFPPMLDMVRDRIDMSLVPDERDLLVDTVSLLYRKP